jgi:dihydropteroate synthase
LTINPKNHSELTRDAPMPNASPFVVDPRSRTAARVMGIINLTPDSFSDGGRFLDPARALEQAAALIAQGAELLDVGAESTRPYTGASPVDEEEELRRLAPLSKIVALGVPVSIDTMKSKVALHALRQGVTIVNDVWALQRDPDMAAVAADHDAHVVVMHNRAEVEPQLDIIEDMRAFFERTLEIAARAGLRTERLCLDPGVGFGKTPAQSMRAIAGLGELKAFGLPLLVGASRKRFIDSVSASAVSQRLGGSLAAHLFAVRNGAAIVRAHDVFETVQALRVERAIENAGG